MHVVVDDAIVVVVIGSRRTRVTLIDGHPDGTADDNEERITLFTLANNVVAVVVNVLQRKWSSGRLNTLNDAQQVAHYLFKNIGNFENDFVVELTERRHSFEELDVLLLLHQSGPHHDGAEALSLNGPQLAVGQSWWKKRRREKVLVKYELSRSHRPTFDSGSSGAVVENGQFAKHLLRAHL